MSRAATELSPPSSRKWANHGAEASSGVGNDADETEPVSGFITNEVATARSASCAVEAPAAGQPPKPSWAIFLHSRALRIHSLFAAIPRRCRRRLCVRSSSSDASGNPEWWSQLPWPKNNN